MKSRVDRLLSASPARVATAKRSGGGGSNMPAACMSWGAYRGLAQWLVHALVCMSVAQVHLVFPWVAWRGLTVPGAAC